MILIGNLLIGLAAVLDMILGFYMILFFLLFILSWVNPDPNNMFVKIVYDLTNPILNRVRRYIKPIGMLDMAFLATLCSIIFLQSFLVQSMKDYGSRIRAQEIISISQ
jgi:YggT family protein